MAFCREVDDSVDVVLGKDLRHSFIVADVSLHEHIVRAVLNIFEVFKVARISEDVEVDDPVLGISVHKQSDEIASDEARASCYEDISFELFHICIMNSYILLLQA